MKIKKAIIKTKIGSNHQKDMIFELYPDKAPITVENFIDLSKKGFYNNLTFHRIIKNFMIQGGDPQGIGVGGPGYEIKGEFKLNGVNNDIKHERGVISMARSNDYDSAGSQFFICHSNASHLDGAYASFGKLIDGFETLDNIANVETGLNDMPIIDCVITSIIIKD